MTRSDANTYLNERLGAVAVYIGLDTSSDTAGWKPVIDDAWAALGVARRDIPTAAVDDGLAETAGLWLRYHALSLAGSKMALDPDIKTSDPGVDAKRSQVFAMVRGLWTAARNDLNGLGLLPGGGAEYGTLGLGQMEPWPAWMAGWAGLP